MSLDFSRRVRGSLRSGVTRVCNSVESSIDSMNREVLLQNLSKLKEYKTLLESHDKDIARLIYDDVSLRDTLDAELEECGEYLDKLYKFISKLDLRLKNSNILNSSSSQSQILSSNSQIKLPQLPLPEFSNKPGDDLNGFFRNFETILDKYAAISEYEKFLLLEGQLSNEPLNLIKSLQGTQQSYSEAKNCFKMHLHPR